MGKQNRNPFSLLPPEYREIVKQMLLSGNAYSDIADFLEKQGISVTISDVSACAASLDTNAAAIREAQQALCRIMREVDVHPGLDATEAMIQLASRHILHVLANTKETAWSDMDKAKLLSSTIGLVNAASYKKRADYTAQQKREAGIDAVKNDLFYALSAEQPELYRKLATFLDSKKAKHPAE